MELRARRRLIASVACLSVMFGAACSSTSVETRDAVNSAPINTQSAKTTPGVETPHSASQPSSLAGSPAGQSPGASYPAASGGAAPRVPGGTPIETSQYDAEIKRLEQALSKRAGDVQTQGELARAYAARAAKLTEAQQYRSALGDWRRTAKLDAANAEAQNMIATITSIMQSMNRPVPAPGEEPPPLPFK
jgi:hypothetical protein